MKRTKTVLGLLIGWLYWNTNVYAQHNQNTVRVVGAMRNVMWEGKLFGTIQLDTIANRQHLYGLGPTDYLTGELLILDGRAYRSTVLSDTAMRVEETYAVKAPFFGYANVPKWVEYNVPTSVQTLQQLETYLNQLTKARQRPFLFRLTGIVEAATIHVVNLPKGKEVRSPQEAHQGRVSYRLQNKPVEVLGFFSTDHKSIFTHHDTYLHMHLLTADKRMMGHVDELTLSKKGVKLYLPAE